MMYESQIAKRNDASRDARASGGATTDEGVRLLNKGDWREGRVAEPCRFDFVPLTKLIGYLIDKHHVYARRQMETIGALVAALSEAHGEGHPTLARVRGLFKALRQELLFHMEKEEVLLFPDIIRTESAARSREPQIAPYFGPMRDPIKMLMREHDDLCATFDALREATNDYTPCDADCADYRALCRALRDLELDQLQLICLEDNILFPRALELELNALYSPTLRTRRE
ncbi:MAG TPA: hemerythrin domain-containing protein [Pyrinomonadaceae bacterium]|nr:hemerythrin domain-containing protein [Pyrinomonadaceae bacterium]